MMFCECSRLLSSGAHDLPALAIHAPRGEMLSGVPPHLHDGAGSSCRSWVGGLNESGVLEELDEHLVDKLVLGDGLDHEHPLLPEQPQHHRHVHLLQDKRTSTTP